MSLLYVASLAAQQSGGSPASARATSRTKTAAEAPGPYRISGTVINSLSSAPVHNALLTVSPMGARRSNGRFGGRAGGQTAAARADAEGHFNVEVPSAGGWSLSASARGYHTQALEEHDGYSTAIILTEAKPVHDVVFRLTPAAAIEGYVLDEAGEAVRDAQVTLSLLPPASPEEQHPRQQTRGSQRTDDRGYYKFSGLLAGSYNLRVQAQPWYATSRGAGMTGRDVNVVALSGGPGSNGSAPGDAAPDPLDVVYPVVWFPGVTDFAMARPVPLRGGETKEADLRLLPVPGFHLHIGENTTSTESESRSIDADGPRGNAYVTQILPDGTESQSPLSVRMGANGSLEFAGLAPGEYVIHRPAYGDTAAAATIRIAENSARTVDVTQATPAVPVAVKVDGVTDLPSLQISFRNVETGHVSLIQGRRELGRRGQRRGRSASDVSSAESGEAAPDRTISLPPAKYEVVLSGINDLHLTGIEAAGATAIGRTVTIAGGSPVLTLHVASGRASVAGVVASHGEPVQGAMVLLIPASLGDPAALEVARRDQSNTDGSFDLANVLPGKYILVAIDQGWGVNWADSTTLQRFLLKGLPLDLTTPEDVRESVEAQSP